MLSASFFALDGQLVGFRLAARAVPSIPHVERPYFALEGRLGFRLAAHAQRAGHRMNVECPIVLR
jgi:hypothetical protein